MAVDGVVVAASRGRGRGRGRGRPRGGAATAVGGHVETIKSKSRGASVARRGRGAFRVYDLDTDSRSVAISELRKWLEEEVRAREERKTFALDFIDDQLPAYEKDVLERVLPKLEHARSKIVAGAGANASPLNQDELVGAVGALRELTHLRPTLAMISDEKITSMLKDIMDNGPDVLGNSSRQLLEKWLNVGTAHAAVFDQAELYNQDPRPAGEALIRSTKLDRFVTAITHRQINTNTNVFSYLGLPTAFGGAGVAGGFGGFGAGQSLSTHLTGPGMARVASTGTGVGACGALGSPGVASEASDVLETNPNAKMMDDNAILPPYEQGLAKDGVQY